MELCFRADLTSSNNKMFVKPLHVQLSLLKKKNADQTALNSPDIIAVSTCCSVLQYFWVLKWFLGSFFFFNFNNKIKNLIKTF